MIAMLNSETTETKKTEGSDLGTESEWEVRAQADRSGGARRFDVGSWKDLFYVFFLFQALSLKVPSVAPKHLSCLSNTEMWVISMSSLLLQCI